MPTTRGHASRIALAQRVERLVEVDGDRLDRLARAATPELPVDPGHRQIEQLDGDPALPDVGAEEVPARRIRRENRDWATAARRDRPRLHHQSLRDQLGHQVRDRGDREPRLTRDRRAGRLPGENDAAQRHAAIALAHIAHGCGSWAHRSRTYQVRSSTAGSTREMVAGAVAITRSPRGDGSTCTGASEPSGPRTRASVTPGASNSSQSPVLSIATSSSLGR